MKYLSLIFFIVFIIKANAQQAFHNMGNIKIHENGQIGFHTNLINDGVFNQNLGLAGFYNQNNSLSISGTSITRFFNFEVAVDDNLFLDINTEITNNLNFIIGHVVTPRDNTNISLDFLNDAFNALESNNRNTDGYSSYTGNDLFKFPIGDDDKLRPLITPAQTTNPKFSAAYFNEDPNFPSTFNNNFSTDISEEIIKKVSINEFWDFNGDAQTQVTLTWNQESAISDLIESLDNLRVVGWSLDENRWVDLGNFETTGNINTGTITSFPFIPNNFEIITFGSLIGSDGLTVYNLFSPNDDNNNDSFVIEGVDLFENTLKVYNRWGNLVYETFNYKNDWKGIANVKNILKKGEKLPAATYFYVLELPTENKNYTGWLYINY